MRRRARRAWLAGLVAAMVALVPGRARAEGQDALWPALGFSEAARGAPSGPAGTRDSGLVIAIEDYSEVDPVPGAVALGKAWLSWLQTARGVPATRLKLLTDRQAINVTIEKEARRLAAEGPAGGIFWLVFIGHGAPSQDARDGVLVGYDAQQTADGLYARSVRHGELLEAIRAARRGRAGDTVSILDACFSGRTQGGRLVEGLQPLIVTRGGGRGAGETLVTAGGSDEFAGPLPGLSQPGFSYLLLGALSGWREADADADGAITLAEAVGYARSALAAVVSDRTQTPQLDGEHGGLRLARAGAAGPELGRIQQALVTGPEARRVGVSVGGGGRLEGGARAVGASRLAADIARAAAYEAFAKAKDAALARERGAGQRPEDKAAAWEAVAPLAAAAGNAGWQAQATANAADWRKVAALRPGMVAAWEKISALLQLPVVPRSDRLRMLKDFLESYGLLGAEPSFAAAQAALRGLGEIAMPGPRAPVAESGGPGEVGAGLVLDVDVTHLRWEQEVAHARAAAEAAEKDAASGPGRRADAWQALARALELRPPDLPSARAEAAAGQAGDALRIGASWRALEARIPQARAEWVQLKQGLGLATADLANKKGWVAAFLGTYGQLTAEPSVAEARVVAGLLDRGEAFPLRALQASQTPRGFIRVAPGSFSMGSPESEGGREPNEVAHRVTLTRAFWLQATEVTQGQWQAVMGSAPSRFTGCGHDCPIEQVSWEDAVAYLNTLSDREGLERCYEGSRFKGLDCRGYRLPTEAEWEYAARAGTNDARHGPIDDAAWHAGNSDYRVHPVAQRSPNRWGLHDMLGNVWEWVQDWYGPYEGVAADPTGPPSGAGRVGRGGGWSDGPRILRAAYRERYAPRDRKPYLGFRAARTVPADPVDGPRGLSAPTPPAPVPSAPTPAAPVPSAATPRGGAAPHLPSPSTGGDPGGFVRIAAGTFAMGSPVSEVGRDSDETLHQVTLTRSFWLQATEVTQGQWEAVMGANPAAHKACGRDCPVENVSWLEAVAYLNALSQREGLTQCYDGKIFRGLSCGGYRLPTEAEWEYAARAGTTGAPAQALGAVAWLEGNSGLRTHPVALKAANQWGLHDMLGNVWEWVHDWYGPYDGGAAGLGATGPLGATDPAGLTTGEVRVLRGGSCNDAENFLRPAYRYRFSPHVRRDNLGFRAARSVPVEAAGER
jgi:formylglycine-generating enzyme required for sulfatase activity